MYLTKKCIHVTFLLIKKLIWKIQKKNYMFTVYRTLIDCQRNHNQYICDISMDSKWIQKTK